MSDERLVNEVAEKSVQKLMALPLLPPGEIVNGFHVIEAELQCEGLVQAFKPVTDHVNNYWLNDGNVGVDVLSVFELDSRTNNAVESSHFQFYRKLRLSRPNFWIFHGIFLGSFYPYLNGIKICVVCQSFSSPTNFKTCVIDCADE